MRLHERTIPVQRFGSEFGFRVVQQRWNLYAEYAALAAYGFVVAGRLEQYGVAVADHLAARAKPVEEIAAAVAAEQGFQPTDVEMLQILASAMQATCRSLLRLERHPDDPDRRADEAADDGPVG